jgi:signal peptidase I
LQLDGNQISDISTLSGLNKSAYLTLTDNPIADWSPVAHVEVVLGRPLSAASAVNIVMNGSSMLPTITDGEKLTVKRINDYTPNNGDIIAFTKQDVTDEPLVRRVIAIARETVDINFDSSLVYVDGITLDEPYINEPIREIGQTIQFPAIIPDEYCFVMGDNRNHSLDSRNPSVGFVAVNEIIGIASAAT